jgi:4-amino-4-deoxy-L-arabinose transferase-like glycosyltransferase
MRKADSPWHVPSAAAILCAALCVRVLLPLIAYTWTRDARIFNTPDTASYRACAESLARIGSFSIGRVPEIVRTPGYPVLLVPGVALGHVTAVTVLLQLVLGCATVLLVYRVAFILTGSRPSAAASGLLCAFEPLSVLYCSLLLAETLFATTLMLFLFLLLVYLKRGTMRHLAAAACALAVSVYVRPIAYWMPLVMTLLLAAAACGRRGRRGRDTLRAFAFLCICAALIGVWQVRNVRETGYRGFSGIGEQALYFYDAAAVEAAVRGESYYTAQRRVGYHGGAGDASEARRLERMAADARRIILAHPGTFAIQYARGVARTMFDPGAIDYLKFFGRYREGGGLLGEIIDRGLARTVYMLARTRPALFWGNLILGLVLLVYLGSALTAFARGPTRGITLAAVAVIALYLIILSGGANALGRFRHPVMPLVCVLAGCGLERVGRRGDRRTGHAGGIHHGAHDDARPPVADQM